MRHIIIIIHSSLLTGSPRTPWSSRSPWLNGYTCKLICLWVCTQNDINTRVHWFGFGLKGHLLFLLTSTDTFFFLFRVMMDNQALLAPQDPLEKRSGTLCTFPSENVLPMCHYFRDPSVHHVGQPACAAIAAINHFFFYGDGDLFVFVFRAKRVSKESRDHRAFLA